MMRTVRCLAGTSLLCTTVLLATAHAGDDVAKVDRGEAMKHQLNLAQEKDIPVNPAQFGNPAVLRSGNAQAPSGHQGGIAVGGEDCASATVIGALPFSDVGDTTGFADDYDEICPFNTPGSPDVVYAYTPGVDEFVDISLCADSAYDTKLYVYENACGPYQGGTAIACNDDACSTPSFPSAFVSQLAGVPMTAGNTYYIVVDGYNGAAGAYTIDVSAAAPPAMCPADTLFGQNPSSPSDLWNFGVADADWSPAGETGLQRWERYDGLTGQICGVTFYGIRAFNDGLASSSAPRIRCSSPSRSTRTSVAFPARPRAATPRPSPAPRPASSTTASRCTSGASTSRSTAAAT